MKKYAVLAMAALAVTAGSAFAEGEAFQVETEVGVLSHYVWRGVVVDERPTMQGNITVSHESGFFADVWANYALSESSDFTDKAELNEVDYTLGYASTYENIDYSAGMIIYSFPNDSDTGTTTELFVTAALNNLIVTPYLEVYYDIDDVDGLYAKMGVEDELEISDAMTLTVGASIGYGSKEYTDAYFGNTSDMLLDGVLYTTASYALSEKAAVNCTLAYSELVDNSIENEATCNGAIYGGVSFSYNF
jgi:uncharacterized protein (TIGR02001 family)